MNLNNYLINLSTTTLNLSENLTYGYGNLAVTEINNLRDLLSKAEEMIPVIEAEACMAEAEELDREDRSFNYWMTMLYGKGDVISPMESHSSNKTNRLKRRKANKKHHKTDRYHGKSLEPFLYKEDGEIKESIEPVWRDCRYPVFDKVKHSDDAMDAREQEYYSASYPVEEETKEAEVSTETTEKETGNFDDFLWYLIDTLPEGKFVMLYSFDNGESYEDHDGCAYEFRGVMTKDKVIAELTENLLRHDCEVEVNETEVNGLKGIDFNWDFGTDKDWGDWNGYESFTIIPVSRLI